MIFEFNFGEKLHFFIFVSVQTEVILFHQKNPEQFTVKVAASFCQK